MIHIPFMLRSPKLSISEVNDLSSPKPMRPTQAPSGQIKYVDKLCYLVPFISITFYRLSLANKRNDSVFR